MVDPNEGFKPEDFGLSSDDEQEQTPPPAAAAAAPQPDMDQPDFSSPPPPKPEMQMEDDSLRHVDVSRMKMVLDVPLKVTVELGRTKLLVNDLLQLGQGSVIELDKMAGEPMEIFVNDKLVAMGEVVVVNEKFGVRLTDVMSGVGFEEPHAKDMP
jgi:flagellar motor switch protein FliN/FliY